MAVSWADYTTIGRVDIAVYRDEQLQLVVEAKSKTDATTDWAARMRRNLVAHLAIPNSPFFLLALPDHFYVWRRVSSPLAVIPPDYDVDPTPLLSPYVTNGRESLRTISEAGLTLAVSSWLNELVASSLNEEKAETQQAWLFESGLYCAIEGGVVKPQAMP